MDPADFRLVMGMIREIGAAQNKFELLYPFFQLADPFI
jgi:hypothetical protein